MGDVVFSVSWLLPVTVPEGSPFLYIVVRNRNEIYCVLNEFLVLLCSVSQEVPTRETMPMSQYDKHTLHCVLGSVSSNSHNSIFPTSRIICFDSGLKGLND